MRAAVVTSFDQPPAPGDFRDPPARPGHHEVDMLAVGVHRIVRSIAAGQHYSNGDELPFVLGVDGVGVLADGLRVYTGGTSDPWGTLAERAVVPRGFTVPVPDALATVQAAAVVNPAMSSWLPLVGAPAFAPGATVLVLGAGGVSGGLAVRIALHLGAGRVLAAARRMDQLSAFATDDRVSTVALDDHLVDRLRDLAPDGVDVVLDYLWGPVAEATLHGLGGRSSRAQRRTDYVQIGALAGRTMALDAAALRSSNTVLSGSGVGSIDPSVLLAEIPRILDLAATGAIAVDVTEVPLGDLGAAWERPGRLVVTLDA